MEVRIGIQHVQRELSFESAQTTDAVEKAVLEAVGANTTLRIADQKGTVYLVPAGSIGYVELGTEETRRVGFVA